MARVVLVGQTFVMPVQHKILGEIIRQEREKRNLSQEHLAALACLSRTYLSEVERGVANISLNTFLLIADGLAVQPSEILQEYERKLQKTNK